jgi:hypothetical protein
MKRTSEPPHFCVLHQARQDLPVPDMPVGIFYRTSLTSPQISAARHIAPGSRPAQGTEALPPKHARCGANRPAASRKTMSWQQLIASNALTRLE